MTENKNVRMSFVLDEKLKNQVQAHAKNQGMSFSSYMRNLLIRDLEKTRKSDDDKNA